MIYCLTIPSAHTYVLSLANIIIIVSMLQTEIDFFACTLHSPKNSFNILWIAEIFYDTWKISEWRAVHGDKFALLIFIYFCTKFSGIENFKFNLIFFHFFSLSHVHFPPHFIWRERKHKQIYSKVIEFKITGWIEWHGISFF